ncbi:hypothetical protein AB0O95_04615 [Rhodoglobus sp. NPDC076762]
MNLKTVSLPRSILAAVIAGALAVSLSACAPTAPDFDPDAASLLQTSVADITDAAAAGDPAAALAALDILQEQLNESTATGAIGAERSAQIQASIDLVRADLIAALPEPAPTADPEDEATSNGNGNGSDNGNGNGNDKPEKPGKPDKDEKKD